MKYSIKEVFCIWCDLLGYSTPFVDSNWNLYDLRTVKNFERITRLTTEFQRMNFELNERSLVLNDVFIRSTDIEKMSDNSLYNIIWLEQTIMNFYHLNQIDKSMNFPGARGILTYGHRYNYMSNQLTLADITQSTEERLKELSKTTLVYSPKEFQMNTGFSKAYIMESAGSRAGLSGSNLFIDKEFIDIFIKYINTKKAYFIILDDDIEERKNKGLDVTSEGYQPTKLRIEEVVESDFISIRFINNVDGVDSLFFALYFDKNIIYFSDKGINTNLYKLIAYTNIDLDGRMFYLNKK